MGLWRIDLRPRPGRIDPPSRRLLATLREQGLGQIDVARTWRIFILELASGRNNERQMVADIARDLLADPVTETTSVLGMADTLPSPAEAAVFEVFLRPGVMDNVAQSTEAALRRLGVAVQSVRTGRAYVFSPMPDRGTHARLRRLLGNECIEEVVAGHKPLALPPAPPVYEFKLRHVQIRDLSDDRLSRLSRDGHLFLSLDEMRAIQAHFRALGRDPTDLELETVAQTWSEHCVHKTLKSAIEYRGAPFPLEEAGRAKVDFAPNAAGDRSDRAERDDLLYAPASRPVARRYENLLRDTIARATDELMKEGRGPECLSVFKDNAGIIGFDDRNGVAFKVETHNHPSAIEPYGGAATGVGGVIRDVLGCGLGAKSIANTDVFCVAPPDWPDEQVPKGAIHPQLVLKGVVSGVRDYGNRMGIPTVNGAVHFDGRYLGNPLVYCGCVGLIPRDRIAKAARPGDAIVLIGGRTGRDGIHGATFSSAELTDTHVDEFAHAVQIGNAIEEKKVLDVVLLARDYIEGTRLAPGATAQAPDLKPQARCLFSAITDCGAGGLSSAVGEMGEAIGAEVDLDRVPLKYAGLRYDEIWISEAQERMVLAVAPENLDAFLSLARGEDVEATVIGRFTDSKRLVTRFKGTIVGDLDMAFLHNGLPRGTLSAEWTAENPNVQTSKRPNQERGGQTSGLCDGDPSRFVHDELLRRLSNPTVASKHWIIRQYDHEVQGRSVIKPLVGPGNGPSDAAVVRPRLDSNRGIALGCGLAPDLYDVDPYWMAVAAIDEALRNVVCVGGDPTRTAILDNFCWPRVDNARNLGALVRACQACYDVAKAYGLPFISGKDSLNNEFALDAADLKRMPPGIVQDGRIAIPGTLLISALSVIEDVSKCITMELKRSDSQLVLLGRPMRFTAGGPPGVPLFDPSVAAATHTTVARLIHEGLVYAAHDLSDGGLLVALAEMAMAGNRSCELFAMNDSWSDDQKNLWFDWVFSGDQLEFLWRPYPATYVLEVPSLASPGWQRFREIAVPNAPWLLLDRREGHADVPASPQLSVYGMFGQDVSDAQWDLADLRGAWQRPLDW